MTVMFVFNGPFNFKTPSEWDGMMMGEAPTLESSRDDENVDASSRKSKKSRLS